jgi:hypothetical protein
MTTLYVLLLFIVGCVTGVASAVHAWKLGPLGVHEEGDGYHAFMHIVCGIISTACLMAAGYVWGAS